MEKFENAKENKKQTKKYIKLGIGAVVVLLLAVMPMMAANREMEESAASILSATVEARDIDTQIIGGGQLSSESYLNVRIPENVKLTEYLVGNGDIVSEGDAIAKVDKVSVMTAITEVQETLDYLADEIADASDDAASTSVKALAGGTVKVIYAREGESVQNVMLDHGALAVLSLDNVMAVKIERESSLDVGDTVVVTLPDGTEVDARVKTNLEDVLTITMEDDDYSVGAKVTVTTEDGDRLGAGELYIFSPWSATAYSGMVADILVDENDTVYIGQSMFTLEDTGNSAQFQRLIDQRQEYEELMQELFTMYRTETITAPCDGIVTGVDKNGTYLLSDNGDGWIVSLLSFFSKEDDDGFIAYSAKVMEVTDNGMTLLMSPERTYIGEMSELSTVAADITNMTEVWNYSGSTMTYTQNAEGLLQQSGSAKVGDILLAVGDEEQVYWFVVLNGNRNAVQTVQTRNPYSGILAFLLSDTETPTDTCTGDDACTASSHNDGCPKNPVQPAVCTGDDSCAADSHNGGCPKNPVQPVVCTGNDSCTVESHNSECPKNPVQQNTCTEEYGCTASTHNVGCPVVAANNTVSFFTTEEGDNDEDEENGGNEENCTGASDCTAETHDDNCKARCNLEEGCTASNHKDGCASQKSSDAESGQAGVSIITSALNQGVVGQSYNSPLQATDGTNVLSGTWAASVLPAGLSIDANTGVISGTPVAAGTYTVTIGFTYNGTPVAKDFTLTIAEATSEAETYLGYVAQVVEIGNGAMKVKKTAYAYTITDLNNLPVVSIDTNALTQEVTYSSGLITETSAAVNDYLLIVVEQDGTLKHFVKQEAPAAGTPGDSTGGMPSGGSVPSGGGMSSGGGMNMGGMGQTQTFETYTLDKLTVASVTSQEHMTVSITIDELDITSIYVGQEAIVSVDALGGEQFEAQISRISNSGENEGGNSKFTVEVTLAKSGDMLPGMYSSAFITLDTSESVPTVPVAALNKSGVETILYTSYDAEEGTLGNPVVVTIGCSDGENVEIISGLALGQTCYYEYYDTYVESNAPQQGNSFNLGAMMGRR